VIVGLVMMDLSNELRRDLLCLPDDVRVVGAVLPEWPDCVRLMLDGDGFETEADAVAATTGPLDVIGPVRLGVAFEDAPVLWQGAYYPWVLDAAGMEVAA